MDSTHGKSSCADCHGGAANATTKEDAHKGIVVMPTLDKGGCSKCHAAISESFPKSLHATLQGYKTVLDTRGSTQTQPALETMFGNHCSSCHTTCGDCHVSQPRSVGGGFLDGHVFEKKPPMTRTCTACHGSRVGSEFLGKHEEIPGDVHFRTQRMNCVSCHPGTELHTTEASSASHRYAGTASPRCETCHAKVGGAEDKNAQHTTHGNKLACQVCHSVDYQNCEGCHTSISTKTNSPMYKVDKEYLGFFIGRNTLKDASRPYQYVTVRHIPAAADNFEFYGKNLLPNFNKLPTWAYATPHNIQRQTPQNASCDQCHGNPKYFLTSDKVAKDELEANRSVIIEKVPPKMGQ